MTCVISTKSDKYDIQISMISHFGFMLILHIEKYNFLKYDIHESQRMISMISQNCNTVDIPKYDKHDIPKL